ncbi:MAG: biotin/lipoyl-containing protein [Dehalococcoidia bacterium]
MAVSVRVPEFGEGMSGGVVAEWYQPDGSNVSTGEPICRVEYEFVAFEVEAEQPGLLRHSLAMGSVPMAGGVIGLILAPGEADAEGGAQPADEPDAPPHDETIANETISSAEEFPAEPAENNDAAQVHGEPKEPQFEAVVVPFKRRFTDVPAIEWDHAPGDEVDFDSGFFSGKPDAVTEALDEPGGSIPGLALWETEESPTGATAPGDARSERYARISAEAAAAAQVLSVTVGVNVQEADRLAAACRRAWAPDGSGARIEDVVFRAIAVALDEAGSMPGAGALVIAEIESDVSSALASPEAMTLREAVAARADGGNAAFEDAEWTMVSLAELGVISATAYLAAGRGVAFALAAQNESGTASLTMSYDSSRWSEGSAARLLSRVRELAETPYAMLV